MRPTLERAAFLVLPPGGGGARSVVVAQGLGEGRVTSPGTVDIAGEPLVVHGYEPTREVVGGDVFRGRASVFDVAGYLRHLGFSDGVESLLAVAGLEAENNRTAPAMLLDAVRLVFALAISDDAFPDTEFAVCSQTVQINEEGICLDPKAIRIFAAAVARRRQQELSALVGRHPRFNMTDLRSELAIEAYAAQLPPAEGAAFVAAARRVQQLGQAAKRAERYSSAGEVARPLLRWNGTHTGRFSARSGTSGVNIHSLPKGKADLPELGLERAILIPPKGSLFRAADLSTVEARIVAWLTGDPKLLDRFRRGEDVYAWFGGQIVPGATVAKTGPNAHLRALGKVSILGLCFGMGLATFVEQAQKKAPGCSVPDIEQAFHTYHRTFPSVRSLIALYTRHLAHAYVGRVEQRDQVVFRPDHVIESPFPAIALELPTGRTLFYRGIVGGGSPLAPPGLRGLWYAPSYTPSASARRPGREGLFRFHDGVWRARLTGNVVLENVTQAIARDVMVHQALELDKMGLPVQFHVHDEIVVACRDCGCEVHRPGCSWSEAGDDLLAVMSRVPATLPRLADLPLAAELNDKVGNRYG